jgi:hypothetical protein
MLVTLKELQSRIETVRRKKSDIYGDDVLLLLINGQVVDATRETIQIDDTGTMIIQAQLQPAHCGNVASESHVEKCADSFPDFLVRPGEHIESRNSYAGRKCVCGSTAFIVEINTGKTFQYCLEFIVACVCGQMTVRSTAVTDVIKIWDAGREIENGIPGLYASSPPMPWKAAFERLRKNQYTDHRQVTMFNFSREKMNDAMEVAAAADEAIEWGCRWESLCSAQSELIKTLEQEIKRLSKLEDVRVIGRIV